MIFFPPYIYIQKPRTKAFTKKKAEKENKSTPLLNRNRIRFPNSVVPWTWNRLILSILISNFFWWSAVKSFDNLHDVVVCTPDYKAISSGRGFESHREQLFMWSAIVLYLSHGCYVFSFIWETPLFKRLFL